MLQACPCVLFVTRGETWLFAIAPSFRLPLQWLLFIEQQEQPGSRASIFSYIKMLYPKQPLKIQGQTQAPYLHLLGVGASNAFTAKTSPATLLLCVNLPHLFPSSVLYQITLITKYQQMPFYSQPSWGTFLSFSPGSSSLHMPGCEKSVLKCTSLLLNLLSVKVQVVLL